MTMELKALQREGTAEGVSRVVGGGSWNNDNTGNFRSAYRNNNKPDNRNNNNGFRCASTLNAGVRSSTEAGARTRESRLLPGCPAGDGRIQKRGRETGSPQGERRPASYGIRGRPWNG